MLTYTSNFTLTPPSAAAAAGGKIKMQDSSNHPATMVAMILPAAVCLVVVIALLLYHYYRRASGPVWIPKVLMNSSHVLANYASWRNYVMYLLEGLLVLLWNWENHDTRNICVKALVYKNRATVT